MNLLEDCAVVQIDANYGIIRLGNCWFFLNADNVNASNLRDAKSFGMGEFLENAICAAC